MGRASFYLHGTLGMDKVINWGFDGKIIGFLVLGTYSVTNLANLSSFTFGTRFGSLRTQIFH